MELNMILTLAGGLVVLMVLVAVVLVKKRTAYLGPVKEELQKEKMWLRRGEYNAAMVKGRQNLELLLKLVAEKNGIQLDNTAQAVANAREEEERQSQNGLKNKGGRRKTKKVMTHQQFNRWLADNGYLDRVAKWEMNQVRLIGNKAVHENYADKDDAWNQYNYLEDILKTVTEKSQNPKKHSERKVEGKKAQEQNGQGGQKKPKAQNGQNGQKKPKEQGGLKGQKKPKEQSGQNSQKKTKTQKGQSEKKPEAQKELKDQKSQNGQKAQKAPKVQKVQNQLDQKPETKQAASEIGAVEAPEVQEQKKKKRRRRKSKRPQAAPVVQQDLLEAVEPAVQLKAEPIKKDAVVVEAINLENADSAESETKPHKRRRRRRKKPQETQNVQIEQLPVEVSQENATKETQKPKAEVQKAKKKQKQPEKVSEQNEAVVEKTVSQELESSETENKPHKRRRRRRRRKPQTQPGDASVTNNVVPEDKNESI